MSLLISSLAMRRVQLLKSSLGSLQKNQGTRFFSVGGKFGEPTLLRSFNLLVEVPQRRTLYADTSLGLDRVNIIRENKLQLYQNHKDRYIERLVGYLESGNTQSILKDDLTNLIGLAENEEHLDLLERIVASLALENDYSSSGWGTAVVRLYCQMNQVDRAYNNLKDEKFGQFFNQYTSYRIVLTMLYNASRYDHVLEIYELARKRLENTRPEDEVFHIPGLAIVAFAALAKQNTPEAMNVADKLYHEINCRENNFIRTRFISLMSYMALNHDKPALAMNLISDAKSKNYVALRELKTLSLLKLKRYEDVVYHLRDSISRSRENQSTPERTELILKEVVEATEATLNEIEDEITRQTLKDTLVELKETNLIGESTLESIVFSPIKTRSNYSDKFAGNQQSQIREQRSMPRQSYNYYNNNRFDRGDNFRGDNNNRFVSRNRQRNSMRDDHGGRNNYNDRQQRNQSKSYFEDDFEDDFDDAISTQKRFR